ncbi:iron ABC transporter permease [Rhodococcus triatomae BKS 15-14]|nr:iron ABC transporter permease [Rhodococcus triatomae BKS 15-14]
MSQVALIAYGALAVALPIFAIGTVAFQPFWSKDIVVGDFTLQNFRNVFDDPIVIQAVFNSIEYSIVATILVVPLGYLCAKAIHSPRHRRPLAGILDLLVGIPLGIPAVIFGVGFLLAFTRGPLKLYGHGSSMIIVCVVCTLPFVTRMLLVALINQGEHLIAVGAVSGAPLWRRTLELELPMLRTALGSTVAISLILNFQEFGASLLVRSARTQVMGTVLYDQFIVGNNSEVAVISFVMCAITGVCVLLALLLARQPRARSR